MRSLLAALRALPVTFALYVLEAVFALTLSVPLGTEASSDARALGARAIFRAAALEHALELLPALRVQGRALALTTLILLALSPFLQMSWLSALAGPLGLRRALTQGARLYLRACGVSLAVGIVFAVCLAPWALAAYLIDTWIDAALHVRQHDLLLLGCALSAVPVLWTAHVTHDLARAYALRHGALTSARRALSAARSLRAQAAALGLWLLGLAIGLSPLLLSSQVSSFGELGAVALLQAGCFATLGLRSVWLAYALTCTGMHATSGEPGD